MSGLACLDGSDAELAIQEALRFFLTITVPAQMGIDGATAPRILTIPSAVVSISLPSRVTSTTLPLICIARARASLPASPATSASFCVWSERYGKSVESVRATGRLCCGISEPAGRSAHCDEQGDACEAEHAEPARHPYDGREICPLIRKLPRGRRGER